MSVTNAHDGLVPLLFTLDNVSGIAEAENGEEGVRLTHVNTHDVALMDLSMPILDGAAATRRLHAEVPATKGVVLTTFSYDASILDAIAAGVLDYFILIQGYRRRRAPNGDRTRAVMSRVDRRRC